MSLDFGEGPRYHTSCMHCQTRTGWSLFFHFQKKCSWNDTRRVMTCYCFLWQSCSTLQDTCHSFTTFSASSSGLKIDLICIDLTRSSSQGLNTRKKPFCSPSCERCIHKGWDRYERSWCYCGIWDIVLLIMYKNTTPLLRNSSETITTYEEIIDVLQAPWIHTQSLVPPQNGN